MQAKIIDDLTRPLNLETRGDTPDLKVGGRIFVPFTILDTRDRGQITLQASDGRIFSASLGCLNATAIVPGYVQASATPAGPKATVQAP